MKKITKITACFLSLLSALFLLSSCLFDIGSPSSTAPESMADEEDIYAVFTEGIDSYATEFIFENADSDLVVKVYDEILADRPDLFWLGNGYESTTTTKGSESTLVFRPTVMEDIADSAATDSMAKELSHVADEIARNASVCEDDFSRLLFVHDTIIRLCEYDKAAAEEIITTDSDTVISETTAYGCLVEGKAVCSGYAAAFQYITEKLGYECIRVNGTDANGLPHQWNCIAVGDGHYFIDVTWDDPVLNGKGDNLSHDYFCLDSKELALTHTIDADQTVPLCEENELNYYKHMGLYFEKYSFDAVSPVIDSNYHNGSVSLKFSSPEEVELALSDLFDGNRIFQISAVEDSGVSVFYHTSSSGLILTISQGK